MEYIYNPIAKNTNVAYDRQALATARYVKVVKAPIGANIRLRLGSKTSQEMEVEKGSIIRLPDLTEIYFSSDIVTDEFIKFIVSDEEKFQIIDPVSVKNIDEVGAFSAGLLTALDKIIQPYQDPTTLQGSSINVVASETMLTKVLTCDKLTIDLALSYDTSEWSYNSHTGVGAYIDGVCVARIVFYGGQVLVNKPYYKGFNLSGKTLVIKGGANMANDRRSYTIQEYIKKV